MQSRETVEHLRLQAVRLNKHVLKKQGAEVVNFARQAGVTCNQFAEYFKNKEKREQLFSDMKNGTVDKKWFEKLQIEAEKIGARVYLIEKLVVDYRISHTDVVMMGGPQTESACDVLKVASLYQLEKKKITETVVLFNWPKGRDSYENAVQFGLKHGLRQTTPHVPFAISEQYPKLNYDLGTNPMYVIETTGCSFDGSLQVCYAYWLDAYRKSDLDLQEHVGGAYDWFAFRI